MALLLFMISHWSVAKITQEVIDDSTSLQKQYTRVLGQNIAFYDEGNGSPVVFLHGNPTSSFLWRNVIPLVGDNYRAIAPDLIGMGDSGKPDIDYSFKDHYAYLEAFLDRLDLDNITFVLHDWGAALGFQYALNHPRKVKRIAFMEGLLPPVFPQPSFEAMGEQMGSMFRAFKDPVQGRTMIVEQNMFIETILPGFVVREMSESAMNTYRRPFLKPDSREPVLAWPRSVPIAGEPRENIEVMKGIERFMTKTKKPMLLVYGSPGALVNDDVKAWYESNIKNLETAYIGQALHFLQEDQPEAIGRAIKDWLRRN